MSVMNFDCIKHGMILQVKESKNLGIVFAIHPKSISLMSFETPTILHNYTENEIEYPPSYFKEYNMQILAQSSIYNGKFIKNDINFEFDSGNNIFFTSDTHFNHDNIINYCNRPFSSVQEMTDRLIDKWNETVQPNDIVFHLGDFAWGGSDVWNNILQRLNGHIHLIIGNHDVKNLRQGYMKYFDSVSFQRQITIEGQSIYLNHYPFLTYGGVYRDSKVWQLFGHVHSKDGKGGADSNRLEYLLPTQYDVGVDNNNYTPINFYEVKRIIESQIKQSLNNT